MGTRGPALALSRVVANATVRPTKISGLGAASSTSGARRDTEATFTLKFQCASRPPHVIHSVTTAIASSIRSSGFSSSIASANTNSKQQGQKPLMSRCWWHRSRARLRRVSEITLDTTARYVPSLRRRWLG